MVAQFLSTKYALSFVDSTLSRIATISGPGLLEAFARVAVFPPGHAADGTDYAFPMAFSGPTLTENSFWAATDIPHLAFWKKVYLGSIPRQYSSSSPINHVGISFTETLDSAGISWTDKVDFEPGQGQPNGGTLVDLLQQNATTVSADFFVRPSQTPPGQLFPDPDFAEGDDIGDGDSGWNFEDAGGGSNLVEFSTTQQRSGDRCVRLVAGTVGTSPYIETATSMTVDPLSSVSVAVWAKAASAGGSFGFRAYTYNSEGLDLYYPPTTQFSAVEAVSTTYARKKARFYVPTGHDRMKIQFAFSSTSSNSIYLDDASFYGDFATLDVKQDYGDDLSDRICFFDSNVFSKQREIDMIDCENIVAASLLDDEHDTLKLHVSRDFPAIQDYGRKEKWLDETSTTVAQATMVETRVEQYKRPISSWTVGAPAYSILSVPSDLEINDGYASRTTLTNRAGIDYSAGDYIGISSEKGRGQPKTSLPLRVQALSGRVDSQGTYTIELTMESLSQLLRRLPPGETRALTSFSGKYWSTSGAIPQAYICKAGGESTMHGALATLPSPDSPIITVTAGAASRTLLPSQENPDEAGWFQALTGHASTSTSIKAFPSVPVSIGFSSDLIAFMEADPGQEFWRVEHVVSRDAGQTWEPLEYEHTFSEDFTTCSGAVAWPYTAPSSLDPIHDNPIFPSGTMLVRSQFIEWDGMADVVRAETTTSAVFPESAIFTDADISLGHKAGKRTVVVSGYVAPSVPVGTSLTVRLRDNHDLGGYGYWPALTRTYSEVTTRVLADRTWSAHVPFASTGSPVSLQRFVSDVSETSNAASGRTWAHDAVTSLLPAIGRCALSAYIEPDRLISAIGEFSSLETFSRSIGEPVWMYAYDSTGKNLGRFTGEFTGVKTVTFGEDSFSFSQGDFPNSNYFFRLLVRPGDGEDSFYTEYFAVSEYGGP